MHLHQPVDYQNINLYLQMAAKYNKKQRSIRYFFHALMHLAPADAKSSLLVST